MLFLAEYSWSLICLPILVEDVQFAGEGMLKQLCLCPCPIATQLPLLFLNSPLPLLVFVEYGETYNQNERKKQDCWVALEGQKESHPKLKTYVLCSYGTVLYRYSTGTGTHEQRAANTRQQSQTQWEYGIIYRTVRTCTVPYTTVPVPNGPPWYVRAVYYTQWVSQRVSACFAVLTVLYSTHCTEFYGQFPRERTTSLRTYVWIMNGWTNRNEFLWLVDATPARSSGYILST